MKKSNGYTINHAEQTIIITREFDKRSAMIGSNEFRILAQLHKTYPEYTIQKRTAAKSTSKNTHKGLTINFMEKHIALQENASERQKEFETVKAYYEGRTAYYSKVKAWFLKKYPDYNNDEIAA